MYFSVDTCWCEAVLIDEKQFSFRCHEWCLYLDAYIDTLYGPFLCGTSFCLPKRDQNMKFWDRFVKYLFVIALRWQKQCAKKTKVVYDWNNFWL